jgi:diaminobutyrate-2-oxoglutarate transaminase
METSGPKSEVFKLFPPLTISKQDLEKGLQIIEESVKAIVRKKELATA